MENCTADLQFMARALQLANKGLYTCAPNPRVGCVIANDGKIIGEGWHQRAGEDHAEVNAILDAKSKMDVLENFSTATAYVTLEPCCHQGKTGPCTQQLLDAGIGRVCYGMEDPNPLVAGNGITVLKNAGVKVDGPLLEDQARALNPGFIKRMQEGTPFIRVKMAMSLDGRTAMANGESKWITERTARQDVQRLRARSCAIVTGIETILQDNASLTVRREELPELESESNIRQPLRVVLDSKGRLPLDAKVLAPVGRMLWITTTNLNAEQNTWLAQQNHVDHRCLPRQQDRIDLHAVVKVLVERQCNEILVEAGATLAGEFLHQGLIDELVLYMAPKLFGSNARPLFELPLEHMSSQLSLSIIDVRAVGNDWRITAKPNTDT
jgi:diaminohydroxyphosphoribosylaminopyrimidine deaminase/5-amino-6-(5-phosphoribosylamino)uracil reductase